MKTRNIYPILVLLILAVLLTSCAQATTPTVVVVTQQVIEIQEVVVTKEVVVTQEVEVVKEVVVTPTAEPEKLPSTQPIYGGNLRVNQAPPVQFDPKLISTAQDAYFMQQMYEYLIDLWFSEDGRPRPWLAESWEVSTDGLTYTFHLRKDVKWQHGRGFVSEDVKYTYDRLREEDSVIAALMSQIDSIETPDDYTVVFHIKSINPDFLFDISDYHALIVPYDIEDLNKEFSGTGPFKLEDYKPEDRAVFVRNEDYWAKDENGNQMPYLDSLELIFLPDTLATLELLHSGDIDFSGTDEASQIPLLQMDDHLKVVSWIRNSLIVIHFKATKKPWDDVRVVQAIKLATDNAELNEAVNLGLGVPVGNSQLGPPFADYYLANDSPPKRDVEKSIALLTEAGYPDGIDFDVYVPNYKGAVPMTTAWQQQIKEAGFRANLIVIPDDVFYAKYWLSEDVVVVGWGPRPTPHQFYAAFLLCDANWNVSEWCDKEFDDLDAKALVELDYDKRVELYHQAEQIVRDRGYMINPYLVPRIVAYDKRIQGVVLPAVGWSHPFFRMWWGE